MQGKVLHTPFTTTTKKLPLLSLVQQLPCCASISPSSVSPYSFRCKRTSRLNSVCGTIRAQASNVGIGSGGYEEREEKDKQRSFVNSPMSDASSEIKKSLDRIPYPLSIAIVLFGSALVFSLIAFVKGGPSSLLAAIAKSGFTAAFTLIFVSEIGDKTFFIAALLAMQYKKGLVVLGSMAALSLMTVLSVVIGRIFHSVPAQFQTTLPLGEYAAVTLLLFFGLKSIKDAWDLPSNVHKSGDKSSTDLDEYVEAEELVKEKVIFKLLNKPVSRLLYVSVGQATSFLVRIIVLLAFLLASKQLSNPLEIIWKSFSLVFFAEWGDRSMLATMALGAAQSPWGVASGAIAGHLLATTIAVLGGAFLASYISEKLVGYIGGALFLVFAVATFFGVF